MFAIALAFVLITVIGLVGNVLVLTVIALNKQMHESTSLFICNLALADLLFLAFCVPLTAFSYLSNSWPFPDQLCYVTVTLQYVTCHVSVWTLVLLAHDRFVSITSPLSNRSLKRSRAVFWVCLAMWGTVLALNSLQMRHVGVLRFEYNGTSGSACVDSLEVALMRASLAQARFFYWGFNLGAYLLPLAMSIAFYFLLVKEIWRQKLVQTKSSQKMKRHATRMVFVVILTFGACWLPQNLRFFLQGLNYPEANFWERDEQTLLLVQSIAQTLAYANSCVNPILYGLLSERFRMAFSRTLSRLCCWGATAGGPPLSASLGNIISMVRRTTPPQQLVSSPIGTQTPKGVGDKKQSASGFTVDSCRDWGKQQQLDVPGGTALTKISARGNDTVVTEWRSATSRRSSIAHSLNAQTRDHHDLHNHNQQQKHADSLSDSCGSAVPVLALPTSKSHQKVWLETLGEENKMGGEECGDGESEEDEEDVVLL
uniref:G_PROTEIN_RECEP_F1_2 domain-containing protein n=1 Tax=Globodera pallida TaxID=36090 RepID=A0A183BQM1_GLOPA